MFITSALLSDTLGIFMPDFFVDLALFVVDFLFVDFAFTFFLVLPVPFFLEIQPVSPSLGLLFLDLFLETVEL